MALNLIPIKSVQPKKIVKSASAGGNGSAMRQATVRKRNVRRRGDRAHFNSVRTQMLAKSNGLPPPPAAFDPAVQYRVKLSKAVPVTSDNFVWLRPIHDVVISGAFANTIKSVIVGAVAL